MGTDGGASDTTDPAAGSSTGTDVSLRDYIERRLTALGARVEQKFDLNALALAAALTAQETATAAALTAAQKAVDKAEIATEKRFDSVNEFRAQLADQAQTFMRVDVASPQFTSLDRRLEALETARDQATGRGMGTSAALGYIIAAVTILGFALTLIILAANGHL